MHQTFITQYPKRYFSIYINIIYAHHAYEEEQMTGGERLFHLREETDQQKCQALTQPTTVTARKQLMQLRTAKRITAT